MYTCEVVLKTAQETGESQGISKNHWEIVGIWGKFKGNLGKIGELCFPDGKTELPGEEINSPLIGGKGRNEGKLFNKNSHLGNLCEAGGENEREMKGNFVFTTSFICTVL